MNVKGLCKFWVLCFWGGTVSSSWGAWEDRGDSWWRPDPSYLEPEICLFLWSGDRADRGHILLPWLPCEPRLVSLSAQQWLSIDRLDSVDRGFQCTLPPGADKASSEEDLQSLDPDLIEAAIWSSCRYTRLWIAILFWLPWFMVWLPGEDLSDALNSIILSSLYPGHCPIFSS